MTRVLPAGERAVLLEVDGPPSAFAARIRSLAGDLGIGLQDVVPGAATVLVVADRSAHPGDLTRLAEAVAELVVTSGGAAAPGGPVVDITVAYDGEDLPAVADAAGLSVAEVVELHAGATYRAEFCGFAPGFAYLAGLPAALHLPRRDSPRSSVPAGSVAIADRYSAVYPRASPGGWLLVGHTDEVLWDVDRDPPARIEPGTEVRFHPAPGS